EDQAFVRGEGWGRGARRALRRTGGADRALPRRRYRIDLPAAHHRAGGDRRAVRPPRPRARSNPGLGQARTADGSLKLGHTETVPGCRPTPLPARSSPQYLERGSAVATRDSPDLGPSITTIVPILTRL